MSARRSEVVLTPAARRDLRDILLDTIERWGLEQDAYGDELTRAFTALSFHPRISASRDDIAPGLRAYRVQQHTVWYRVTEDTVRVIRILHEGIDPKRF
jgi:toxin ParE1/3/4